MSGTQQDVLSLMAMVTMPIGRWNQVLEVLGTQPWNQVNPLIVDLHRQIQDAVNAQNGLGRGSMDQPAPSLERQL